MTGVLLALGSVNADFVVRVDERPEIGREPSYPDRAALDVVLAGVAPAVAP